VAEKARANNRFSCIVLRLADRRVLDLRQKESKMLVLSRQRDESIMIGDDVEIIIVNVRGDKVRLGITAPKHIPVHRKERYEAIQREKAQKGAVKH